MYEGDETNSQSSYQKKLLELQKQRELETKIKAVLMQLLTSDAYERLMNIRLSSPEVYQSVVQALLYLHQSGQINGKIDGEKLKTLASRFVKRKETTITRK